MPESASGLFEFDLIPPSAAALIDSLRGVGYSLPAAVADIIDNSISAEAENIWLMFSWHDGSPTISVRDDGRGMSTEELVNAMRLGGLTPERVRAPTDLGRFGLGLKTASFSQCRRLTVASWRQGVASAIRRWDLDHIKTASSDWQLLRNTASGSESFLAGLASTPSGTIVLWEVLDRLVEDESDEEVTETMFLESIDRVEEHLAMVFQRFLDGSGPRVRIFINGADDTHRVKPWDPFMTDHPATIRRPIERINTRAGVVEVQGFVLPHKDRLTAKEGEAHAGPNGWTAQQGFYIYRNRRLLVAGGWLGLGSPRRWTQEEAYKLARIRIDISNTADTDWKIDIRKSIARPPYYVRTRLRALGDDARQLARQVFAHRGAYGARPPEPELKRVWLATEGPHGVHYRIDRSHPAIQKLLSAIPDSEASALQAALRVIEETVPVQKIWLDATDRGEVADDAFSETQSAEARTILGVMYKDLRTRVGMTPSAARHHLRTTEPFNQFAELVAKLPDDPEKIDQ